MAQSNSKTVPSAPTKQNASTKEMREWYEKRQKENFESAEAAYNRLRDYTKTTTKTVTTFSKETLRTYLQNIGSNERNLRNLSRYMDYRSRTYNRLIRYYASMFCLDARSIIPEYDMVKGGDAKKTLKSYNDTLTMMDKLHLQLEFLPVEITCFLYDVSYNLAFYDDVGLFFLHIDPDYAKISGRYSTGDFAFAIDMSYYRSRQEYLEYFPEPLQSMYNEYQSSGEKWQPVPDEYCACFKFNIEDWELVYPPILSSFNSFINLSDLEDIQSVADKQEIYKMIWLEMETLTNSEIPDDWKVNPEIMVEYYNKMIAEALPDYITAAIIPGKLNTISFNNDKATDTNKVAKATETVLNTAGGAQVLNGVTISGTTAFEAAMQADTEYAISSLLPQFEAWLNRFLTYYVSKPSRVRFFPVSVYTKDKFKKAMLEAAQYGLPTKLAYNTLNGFSERDTMALNFLEEEVLQVSDKFKPLQSSYTQTDNESGAPEKDSDELTDDGEASRDKRDKAKG